MAENNCVLRPTQVRISLREHSEKEKILSSLFRYTPRRGEDSNRAGASLEPL